MRQRVVVGILVFGVVAAAGVLCVRHEMDFPVYYDAANRAARGDPDLFQLGATGGLAYRYAPVVALLLTPFTLLPVQVAGFVWFLLKVAAFAGTVRIARRLTGFRGVPAGKMFIVGFLLAGAYIVEDLATGNMHSLAIFGVVLACDGIARGRVAAPSVALALAILVKLTPAIALPYLAARREWRVFVGVVVVIAVLCALPSVVVGHETNLRWLRDWKQTALGRIEAGPNEHDDSLKGALVRFFSASDPPPTNFPSVRLVGVPRGVVDAAWLVMSAVFLPLLLWTARDSRKTPARRVFEYPLLVVTILLVSPHNTRLYYCALFFPYLMMAADAWANPRRRRMLRVVLWSAFVVNTAAPALVPGRSASLAYQAAAPFVFSTLVAWLFLYLLTRTRPAEESPATV